MSSHNHSHDTSERPRDAAVISRRSPTMEPSSPIRAYSSPSKTATVSPAFPTALSASLAATLTSKKTYITLPSIQKVIASHVSRRVEDEDSTAPDYDEAIANIPALDLLPPPPVYDIVNCPTSQTVLLVSSLINTILAVNDRLACPKITLFHSRAIPNISIEAYLSRILQYAPFQNEVLLIILLYFDRIGGGCKPTQVLTNTIPKSLLRQASLTPEDISQLVAPKAEEARHGSDRTGHGEKAGPVAAAVEEDIMDEEEPIADEIYTSSSESPVGSKLIINSFNIHRLLITSILVACKFSSDVFYPNVRYARVGGLPLSELNQLELEFLFLSQFELNTTEPELQTYGNKLLMYHQRLNGTERAAYDAITPAKGEYVRIVEKKPVLQDAKVAPSLLRIQTTAQPTGHRPMSTTEPRAFVSAGPYRDSKEILDDDEIMSEAAEDQVTSPTSWQSVPSTPVMAETPTAAKSPMQRSHKMNLNHMIWPTNEVEIKYTPSSNYTGGMVMDEEAARIEEEFNKASPPPESCEPNPKRKIQRLSSGTMEAVPAKRVNNPGKNSSSDKNKAAVSATPTTSTPSAPTQPPASNKNILKPLFRKIASFASNRLEAASVPEPEPKSPQEPALRSHPYLVRHRISPAASSTNVATSEDATSPTSPTPTGGSRYWNPQESHPGRRHTVSAAASPPPPPPPTFQTMKPPPPPYSGQDQDHNMSLSRVMSPNQSTANKVRGSRRQHRSREPSLSSLASELTFEPTRTSLSPMSEESNTQQRDHPERQASTPSASLPPFRFPPRSMAKEGGARDSPQHPYTLASAGHQSYFTPPATPLTKKSRSASETLHLAAESTSSISSSTRSSVIHSPHSETDDNAMQCDEEPLTLAADSTDPSRHTRSEPLDVASASSAQTSTMREKASLRPSERIEKEGAPSGASLSSSSLPSSISPTAGRHWIPRHEPAATLPPVPYPYPHYVASYYPAPPTAQLPLDPRFAATMGAAAPRNPQAIVPAGSKQQSMGSAPRPARQFAAIRPRTPMTLDEDSKGRVVQPTSDQTAALSPMSTKKKKAGASDSKAPPQQQQQSLRPLVPSGMAGAAPPPYRPPFIAYPGPYTHHAQTHGQALRGPDGQVIPPPPMIMAVDYSQHGGGAIVGHAHGPQFIAAGPPHGHGGQAGPRLYIPVIPVMYNNSKPMPMAAVAVAGSYGKAPSKTSTPAKIAPRLHRP
ncbi:hypothetical protein EC968_009094 [Mortierella alpina]|nr:hypothetical protein EC968_009094 [Mortierella alpina]